MNTKKTISIHPMSLVVVFMLAFVIAIVTTGNFKCTFSREEDIKVSEIKNIVSETGTSRGRVYIKLSNNDYLSNYSFKIFDLSEIQAGDSIYKPANSSHLKVYRKGNIIIDCYDIFNNCDSLGLFVN